MLQTRPKAMRCISIAVAVLFLFVSILASTESVNAASRLKVTVTKKTIYVGQTTKFKSNKNVKWSVSNKKVAKLTVAKKRTATVKGLKAGTVYVRAKYGKTIRKIKIVVKRKGPTKINLLTTNDYIGVAEHCTVFVDSVVPATESDAVTFSSSDETVAVVSSFGDVTAVGTGDVTITATSKVNKSAKASVKIKVVKIRAGTITLTVDLTNEDRYPKGEVARVWVPIPQKDKYQYITGISYDKSIARQTTDSAGGKQLYIEWDENTEPKDRITTLSYYIKRREVVRDDDLASKEHGTVDEVAFANELKETRWSGPLDSGIVKEKADEAIGNAETVYDKAFAIYNWVCDKVVRRDNKKVIFGDVVDMLSGGRDAGSCMDVNSIFVALCRAEGIPARTVYGLRFTTGGPNCRAEFYLPGYGWVTADPALAIKEGRGLGGEPKTEQDLEWVSAKDRYWGRGEENWIWLNMGRDIILDPPQSIAVDEYCEILNPVDEHGISTINLFMFPYGEYGDRYIECQDREKFKYFYKYDVDDLNCGC